MFTCVQLKHCQILVNGAHARKPLIPLSGLHIENANVISMKIYQTFKAKIIKNWRIRQNDLQFYVEETPITQPILFPSHGLSARSGVHGDSGIFIIPQTTVRGDLFHPSRFSLRSSFNLTRTTTRKRSLAIGSFLS